MMNYKVFFLLSLFLNSCSDDEPIKPVPGALPVDPTKPPMAPLRVSQAKIISPEKIYLDKMKSAPDNWYLAEISSFAFIAKKQIDLVRLIQNEGNLDIPLYRSKFLTQLQGLRTILTYMRLPLTKIDRGDTASIRFAALEAVKMTYYAKKTSHAGEAMLFCERAKDAYLKVNELSNRELLKPQVPAPYISAELRVNIYKALKSVKQVFDDIETVENSDQGELTKNITEGINQAYNALDAVQAQTDGLGFSLDDIITPSPSTQNGMMRGNVGGSADLSLLTGGVGAGTSATSYGLPSASSLLQAGTANQRPQIPGAPAAAPLPITAAQRNISFSAPPLQPVDRVNAAIGAEAAAGPYGAQPQPMAGASLLGGGGIPAGVAPGSSGGSLLPSLTSLMEGKYPGSREAQPTAPSVPSEPPPPLPPPVAGAAP